MQKVKFFKNYDLKVNLLPFPFNKLIYGFAVSEKDVLNFQMLEGRTKEIEINYQTRIYAINFNDIINYISGKTSTKLTLVPFNKKYHCVKIIKEKITQLDLLNLLSGIGPIVKGKKNQATGIQSFYLIIILGEEEIDKLLVSFIKSK